MDTVNNNAKQMQAREQDADTDCNLSGVTKSDLVAMIKAEMDMLRDTILTLTANRASSAATKLLICMGAQKTIDPARFYSGTRDLDCFLFQLIHGCNIQSHQFQDEAEKVDYALSLLGKWPCNLDAKLRKTQMTNPDEWGTFLVTTTSLCLASLNVFVGEIRPIYGNKDRRLNAAIKTAGEY